MNPRRKQVELRTSKHTTEDGALQKGEDFVKAFTLGFDVDDAIALLRLDDLYSKLGRSSIECWCRKLTNYPVETFEIRDVKQVMGNEAQGRAIGRIAGKDGKTKCMETTPSPDREAPLFTDTRLIQSPSKTPARPVSYWPTARSTFSAHTRTSTWLASLSSA